MQWVIIYRYNTNMGIMNVLSLFDGISCGYLALLRAGIHIDHYYAYEIDEGAITISTKNFPDIHHMGNVFQRDYPPCIDLVIGGSPCTYWSIANVNRESDVSGEGGVLFNEYVAALEIVKPKWFLYENNYNIPKTIQNHISKKLGVLPVCIDSQLVSAQRRKRLYWTNIDIDEPLVDKKIQLCDIYTPEWQTPLQTWMVKSWAGKARCDGKMYTFGPKSGTLTTKKGHLCNYYLNGNRDRYCMLPIGVWEQLQTLPIGYTEGVCETKRYACIGSGWTVDVISYILKGLLKKRC